MTRFIRSLPYVLAITIVLLLVRMAVARDAKPTVASTAGPANTWTSPRTVDGQPDLQGVWANNNATPLERPKRLGDRQFLTEEELAGLHEFIQALSRITDDHTTWLGNLDFDNRTSLITDPPDGRIPPLTENAQARAEALAEAARRRGPADSHEDRPLTERCITFGIPDLLAGYNSFFQIVQTPGYVAISAERIHDVRMIPLDGRPHLASTIRLWHGDSRGRWEGNSLVVDTTNFSSKSRFRESSENLHVLERFTRTAPGILEYEITIEDPTTWTKPWTLMIPLKQTEQRIYEYACHEGNEALKNVLAGARAQERAGADKESKGGARK